MFCPNCGKEIGSTVKVCMYCGQKTNFNRRAKKNKGEAVIFALFAGELGLHRFYMGENKEGIQILAISIICILFSYLVFPFVIVIAIKIAELIRTIFRPNEDFN